MVLRLFALWLLLSGVLGATEVKLCPRTNISKNGHALTTQLAELSLEDREHRLVQEISAGNVPDWWRRFVPVTVQREISGRKHTLVYQVAPDVLMVGDTSDAIRVPLSPSAAQTLADAMECILPTTQMSDQIYHAATVKLIPQTLPPGPEMISFRAFATHDTMVDAQRCLNPSAAGTLIAGHKKDVVVGRKTSVATGKVGIYGWHRSDGTAIQPLYLGHTENWVDYSHGVRLVQRIMLLDGHEVTAESVLGDPALHVLLSNEGPVPHARYDNDRTTLLALEPGIRVLIKAPLSIKKALPVQLVIYATPNGGTAEEAIGRPATPADNWHYAIQQIGAQTHWLRDHDRLANLIVAYVEPEGKSWSAWLKKYDPNHSRLPAVIDAISKRYAGSELRLTLTGHSGGGSFTFGYLDAVPKIPPLVERLAFLDSNYHYETKHHAAKVVDWLQTSPKNHLCVLAYKDYVATFNGKPFVSESGGTWGRSKVMMRDLGAIFPLQQKEDDTFIYANSTNTQIRFLLHQNPSKKILHTMIVERNGFIQALLSGGELEGLEYQYFGTRVYE